MVRESDQVEVGGLGQGWVGWVRRIVVCAVGKVVSVHEGIARCERHGHVIVLMMLRLCLCLFVVLG